MSAQFARSPRYLFPRVSKRIDGPLRPSNKRGKKVLKREHWLTHPFRQMILAFGFHYHMAPGEAEAELALLNEKGLLDIVVTDDVDALVFGARYVLRRLRDVKPYAVYPDEVADYARKTMVLYSASRIESDDKVSLTRGGLFLMAILVGGDYNTGLMDCGIAVGRALAQTGLGDSLLDAAVNLDLQGPFMSAAVLKITGLSASALPPSYRLKVSTFTMDRALVAALPADEDTLPRFSTMLLWVPAVILQRAMPQLTHAYDLKDRVVARMAHSRTFEAILDPEQVYEVPASSSATDNVTLDGVGISTVIDLTGVDCDADSISSGSIEIYSDWDN